MPLITFKRGSGPTKLDDVFAIHGLTPRFAHRVEDSATLHGFVVGRPRLRAASRGSSAEPEGKPLVAVPIESKLPPRQVAIAWHRDRLRTCTAGMFVDLAVEVSAQLISRTAPLGGSSAQPALD